MSGANQKLGLPRDKMKRVVIAFDVDGTLRCNCTPHCQDANGSIVLLFGILATFKNVKLMVWSGGGADYSERFVAKFGLPKTYGASKLDPSTWKHGRPQIAVDDIQDTAMADINLIVREK